MFEFSTKTHYGVAALIDLAKVYGKQKLRIKDIVENRSISQSYLEQIFNRLNKVGLVNSIRGNKGGYELANNPEKIKLFDVIEALEGQLNLSSDKCLTVLSPICDELENDIREKLSITLKELAEREDNLVNQFIYYI